MEILNTPSGVIITAIWGWAVIYFLAHRIIRRKKLDENQKKIDENQKKLDENQKKLDEDKKKIDEPELWEDEKRHDAINEPEKKPDIATEAPEVNITTSNLSIENWDDPGPSPIPEIVQHTKFWDKHRITMPVFISVAVLLSGLYMILSGEYPEPDKKWAFGMIGTIVGYWLKPPETKKE